MKLILLGWLVLSTACDLSAKIRPQYRVDAENCRQTVVASEQLRSPYEQAITLFMALILIQELQPTATLQPLSAPLKQLETLLSQQNRRQRHEFQQQKERIETIANSIIGDAMGTDYLNILEVHFHSSAQQIQQARTHYQQVAQQLKTILLPKESAPTLFRQHSPDLIERFGQAYRRQHFPAHLMQPTRTLFMQNWPLWRAQTKLIQAITQIDPILKIAHSSYITIANCLAKDRTLRLEAARPRENITFLDSLPAMQSTASARD